jgi:hypothetical protein
MWISQSRIGRRYAEQAVFVAVASPPTGAAFAPRSGRGGRDGASCPNFVHRRIDPEEVRNLKEDTTASYPPSYISVPIDHMYRGH